MNNLKEVITLVPLNEEYYTVGKSKIAKVSNRIIRGVGSYYLNNLNTDEIEVNVGTNEENKILPTENITTDKEQEEVVEQPIMEIKEEVLPNKDYRKEAEVLYNKLDGITPEAIDKDINELNIKEEENTSSIDVALNDVNAVKSSWNDFRLLFNEKNGKNSTTINIGENNFDGMFDSLATDINGANMFITKMVDSKNKLDKLNKNLKEQSNELEKKSKDFEEYAEAERKSIEKEKAQAASLIETSRTQLQAEEVQFNIQTEALKAELSLKEESIKTKEDQLQKEKIAFTAQKQLDEETINNEKVKLQLEKEQIIKEKNLFEEKTKNANNELENLKQQIENDKEIEMKKIELERKSLAQSCSRFKELINQFNAGVGQIPSEEE